MNGQALGQDIKNILYYRTGLGIDVEGFTWGGAVDVANLVKTEVWPSFKTLMITGYELQDITVYVYDEQDFHLLIQNPATVPVHEFGLQVAPWNGPATCAIVRFVLEPTSILFNGPVPPRRGYLAVGPLRDASINDDGSINIAGGEALNWNALCNAVSSNIASVIPPVVFFPIRVKHTSVLGIWTITSFADVSSATLRTQSSFRRSRVPES